MRVRVSYGMDIENVPSKVGELLKEMATEAQKSSEILSQIACHLDDIDEEEFVFLLKRLAKAKQKLKIVDNGITEASQILMGLENYYNGEENVPDGRPTMDTSGNAAEQTENSGEG